MIQFRNLRGSRVKGTQAVVSDGKVTTNMGSRERVAVVYSHFPHYREAIFNELNKSEKYSYTFFVGSKNRYDLKSGTRTGGIVLVSQMVIGPFTIQIGLMRKLLAGKFSHIIFLGNPYILTNWPYALLARWTGYKVYFWTHGWLNAEGKLRQVLRNLYYRIPHGLMLYGVRAKSIGAGFGFKERNLHVIYNSLNYESQKTARIRIEREDNDGSHLSDYIVCVARLTRELKIHQAIEALNVVYRNTGKSIVLQLIGDGLLRDELEDLARKLNVNVVFNGAIYDEQRIADIVYHARAMVSPGKVGLTAMHGLAYGIPIITHGNFDNQMPEVEAIEPGITGDFFKEDDVESLAAVLTKWMETPRTRKERLRAIATIEDRYTPRSQVLMIECALASGDR
ncbi:glycosyltransferase family 4 protein [Mesorhizobium sp. M0698]|uniref:glycosyltransferase family 4 protein n=1 Tax=Mesorhizobium sp. M0698 TaxID=2956987 RepID=UPI00333875B8